MIIDQVQEHEHFKTSRSLFVKTLCTLVVILISLLLSCCLYCYHGVSIVLLCYLWLQVRIKAWYLASVEFSMGFCKVGKLFDFPTQKYLPVYLYLAVFWLQSTSLELNLTFEVRKSIETKRKIAISNQKIAISNQKIAISNQKIAISNQNSNLGLLTLWACALPLSYRTRQEASEI